MSANALGYVLVFECVSVCVFVFGLDVVVCLCLCCSYRVCVCVCVPVSMRLAADCFGLFCFASVCFDLRVLVFWVML